ncbi:hypothetical protein [Tropicimonas sp. IMCC34043]|uniref:hypothetical protein n=1 Tax=Tropicimonas sp. IMCC34043 TaxID=2248760 RepID=UPI000E23BC22|nr:hypothetical protein [Tropicimonas sp. IMCC34043]
MNHPLNLTLDLYLQRMERDGVFDGLSGSGAPIEGLDGAAPDVLGRIMAEAHAKPLVVLLNQRQSALREQLGSLTDPEERRAVQKQIADVQTRIAIEIEAWRK